MSRNIVFNESIMFNDILSTDVSPVGSDEEQEHVSVQVEHVDDQETEIVDNNVHDIVQHSPPVLQPQNQSIADRRTKRNCGPCPHLMPLVVLNRWRTFISRLRTLKLLFLVTARSGFPLCKRRCSHSRKMTHGMLCACLNKEGRSLQMDLQKKGGFVS